MSPLRRSILQVFRHPVTRTAFGLYSVQLAVLLIPLATLPYLARTLEPHHLGLVLFSQAFAALLTALLDFGFEGSASRDVSQQRDDDDAVAEIATGVMAAKLVLAGAAGLVALVVGLTVPLFREDPEYLVFAWLLGLVQGFGPMWYFLGRERVGIPATLDLLAKVAAALGLFVVVKDRTDGPLVLALQVAATGVAVLVALSFLQRETGFRRPSRRSALTALRRGVSIALYRGAGIVFQTSPPLLVGLLAVPAQVGFYGLADKLFRVPIAVLWPASQALYPRISYLTQHDPARAARVMRVVVVLFVLTGIAFALGLYLVSGPVVRVLFGAEYEPAVRALQVLSLSLPFALFTHVVSYNVLMPFGRDKGINALAWVGSVLVILFGLALVPSHGALGMAIAVLAETVVYCVLLLAFVFKFQRRRGVRLHPARDFTALS